MKEGYVRLNEAQMIVGEKTNINDMFNVFKDILTVVEAKAVGHRVHKGRKKGTEWLTCEIKKATEEKRRAYKTMLQRNVLGRSGRGGGMSTGLGVGKWRHCPKKVS